MQQGQNPVTSGGAGGGGGGGGFSTGNTETQGGYGASQPLFMGGTGGLTNGGGQAFGRRCRDIGYSFILPARSGRWRRRIIQAEHESCR